MQSQRMPRGVPTIARAADLRATANRERQACEVIALVRRNSAMQARMRDHVRRRGGNCHICGQPVDYTLPYYIPGTRKPNPEAYVADHVIPIDKGGAHDLSNGKPAHWRCNSKKRARLYAPIIKRSGALD